MRIEKGFFEKYIKINIPTFKRWGRPENGLWLFCNKNCSKCPIVEECRNYGFYPKVSNEEKLKWEKEHPEYIL